MSRKFHVLLEWDAKDQVWVTYVPALNFLSTYGETKDEALAMTREAIEGYLDAADDEGMMVEDSFAPAELVEVEVQAL